MSKDFSNLTNYTKGFKPKSFVMFVTLFCIAQLSLLNHQSSHENNESQSACLICIFTPNQIHDTSQSIAVECINEEILNIPACYDYSTSAFAIHYHTRAPPVV